MTTIRRRAVLALGLGAWTTGACGRAETPRAEASAEAPRTEASAKPTSAEASPTKADAKADAKADEGKRAAEEKPGTSKPVAEAAPPAVAVAKASRLGIPVDPEHAVMIAGGETEPGLVVLGASQPPVGRLVTATVSWCRVDPRAGVVWYRHQATGEEDPTAAGTLSFVDLEGDGPPVTVLEGVPETIAIEYPDEKGSRPEAHTFSEGVAVRMDETPRLEAFVGCDGDMAYYCFGDEVEDFEAARTEHQAARSKALAKKPFVGAEAVKGLVARARAKGPRPVPTEPTGPAPQRVATVPRSACDAAPEDCGEAKRLPGTSYWQVVVGNERGDFFHETLALYDPAEKVFFDPRDAAKRSPTPPAGEPFVPRWVSPSGTRAMDDTTLVTLPSGTLAADMAGACGFWGGGWENPTTE